ncbi:MAG: NADH-quinone oxidoreductase subunit L [Opitutaceae bacterium]|jgi:NADH-quinone oxidoreductase subunit L
MLPVQLAILVLLLPLASAAVIALFLRRQGALASFVSVAAAGALAVISAYLIFGGQRFEGSIEWLRLGGFSFFMGIKFDDLAALMLFVVSFVGFFIHLFSLGYMHEDAARARYFGGLSIFMFSMIGIVLADNLFMIFVFWELVGFSSYLLINHWHERQSAADASKKAFIVNRVGDFGFLLGILACTWLNHTVNLSELAKLGGNNSLVYSRAIPLLLFCGAVGKSAQMPLHVWLPDAMEGPTPVSALIHAATMVAAGVYMLCRIQILMVPDALCVIMWVGAATALYSAICAIAQSDIKKVLAYSTLSQLGYMVAAFGLGSLAVEHGGHRVLIAAGAGAAMFHLTTHAFFKGLLFLGSGSVIHGCHHRQDIFKMGGLRTRMPLTFWTFTLGVAAIIGMPFLAGFFSKDAILYLAFEKNAAVFGILALTAVLTSFYMARMWKLAFLGEPRSEEASQAHENGFTIVAPLVVLALLSVVGGYSGVFSRIAGSFFELVPVAHGSAHLTIILVSVTAMAAGAGSALVFYRSDSRDSLELKAPGLFGLIASKLRIDEAYLWYVEKIQQRVASALGFIEQIFIAGLIVRGLAAVVGLAGIGVRALHVGNVRAYIYWFFLGVAFLWGYAAGLY